MKGRKKNQCNREEAIKPTFGVSGSPVRILLLLEQYDYRIHRGVAQVAREQGSTLTLGSLPAVALA